MLMLAISTALAVGLMVAFVASLVSARPAAVGRRIDEVRRLTTDPFTEGARLRREERRQKVEDVLEAIGRRIAENTGSARAVSDMLTHAGYRTERAPGIFWGIRLGLTLVLALLAFLTAPVFGAKPLVALMISFYFAAIGYVLPMLRVRGRARARQKEITLALPDALDLLVICVEAGLGINQAMLRLASEIQHVSRILAEELHMVNLEIRAGRPRNEALRNLAERTGVDDVRGLVGTLVQAERFGTPIGPALRVHAETLRDKRKQRAREAAAKTTIKLVFPLVFCIFPAMFVVLIGPGLIQIIEALGGVG
ncbi:MAG TPA: type II secretion system F family protein [Longimicrobiales bacterium]|nr:type II secretion system F family protein [Longimicrobiales bacterium]